MKCKIIWCAIPLCVLFLAGFAQPAFALQDFLQFESTSIDDGLGAVTAVTIGPDRNLYFMEQSGDIYRHQIDQETGLPTGPRELLFNGNDEIALGLVFSPNATADNLDAFVSYGENQAEVDDDGVITPGISNIARLTLPSVGNSTLATRTDVITNLNVGTGDHSANQPVFGPDGRLYFNQGSVSGGGAQELTLSAATLVADVLAPGFGVVDVSGDYDPSVADAPVQIFATGMRNAYDPVSYTHLTLPTIYSV